MAKPVPLNTNSNAPAALLPFLEALSQLELTMTGALELIAVAHSTTAPGMTTRQAAEYLSLSPRTLEQYRWKGGGPVYQKVGARAVRYRRSDLMIWAEANRRCSTSVMALQTRAQREKAS